MIVDCKQMATSLIFYSRRLHLVIEIDGRYHLFPEQKKDEAR
jgi:hypothetical protein